MNRCEKRFSRGENCDLCACARYSWSHSCLSSLMLFHHVAKSPVENSFWKEFNLYFHRYYSVLQNVEAITQVFTDRMKGTLRSRFSMCFDSHCSINMESSPLHINASSIIKPLVDDCELLLVQSFAVGSANNPFHLTPLGMSLLHAYVHRSTCLRVCVLAQRLTGEMSASA